MQDRIKKGLCFKCGEKWSKEHKCKAGQVFIITEDDEEDEVGEEDASSEDAYLQLVEPEASRDKAKLSVEAKSGVSEPTTMQLMAWIEKQEVTLLVDNGSSHNFINSVALERVDLHSEEEEPFVVRVANGEKL